MEFAVIVNLVCGLLLFQAYAYCVNFSEFVDDYNTRKPLIRVLAVMAFTLNIIALYKAYREEKVQDTLLNSENEKISEASIESQQQKKMTTIEHSIDLNSKSDLKKVTPACVCDKNDGTYPKVCVCDGYHGDNMTSSYGDEKCTNNTETNEEYLPCLQVTCSSEIYNIADDDVCIANKDTSGGLTIDNHKTSSCTMICSLNGTIFALLDLFVIFIGINGINVVVKYYMFYSWTFTRLDWVQLLAVPLVVMIIEVSLSVGRTIHRIMQACNLDNSKEENTKSFILHL